MVLLTQLELKSARSTVDELCGYELDGDLNKLTEVNQELAKMTARRQRTLELLEEYAQLADDFFIERNVRETGGCIAGAAGGLLTTVGGVATIATGGLAAPLLLTGLAVSGTAAGIGGAGFNIWNSINAGKKESSLQETLKNALAEDVEEREKLEDVLERVNLKMEEDVDLYYNGAKIASFTAHCIGNLQGSDCLLNIIANILPMIAGKLLPHKLAPMVSLLLQEITAVGAATPILAKGIAEEAAEQATKEMVDGFSKRYVNKIAKKAAEAALKEAATGKAAGTVAREVAEETAKESARSAARQAAKAAAKQTAEALLKESGGEVAEAVVKASAKKAGKQAAEQVAKKAAQEAAEEATKGAMKTAARLTGAVTIGFGVLTAAWDGYNAFKSHSRVQTSKSELGDELRMLIMKLQPTFSE